VIDPGELLWAFRARFGCEARLYRAPGRVNLIGEHTDYNDGFVMPIALDRQTWVAAAPRTDRLVVAYSREYGETVTIDLHAPASGPTGQWVDYVRGIAAVLDGDADLIGANLLIASDVPIGAGLSSSAALEVACGYALADLSGRPIDLSSLARAAQRAEHEYAARTAASWTR
jgi:galactokinase